jgi:hypothetical protein
VILINISSFSFKLTKLTIINIPLILIITHSFLILLIPFECRFRSSMNKNETKGEKLNDNKKKGKGFKLIFNKPEKRNIKSILILISMILLELAYDTCLLVYQRINKDQSELVLEEIYKFMDILFLLILFRLFHDVIFYRHQYISLAIIIITGIFRLLHVFLNFFFGNEKSMGYATLIFIILLPVIDSIKIYFIQKYMKYNYYSPYFICILIGFIYLIISIIILIIFRNINCTSDICIALSEINIDSYKNYHYVLLAFYGLSYASEHLAKFYTMYTFSAFHCILITTFGEIVKFFYKMLVAFNITEFIVNIVTYSLEIFAIYVFIETIELNFCGLNVNLKKNIIFRAEKELYSINKLRKGNEDDVSVSNESGYMIDLSTYNEDNYVLK